jgi:hypothetical protein
MIGVSGDWLSPDGTGWVFKQEARMEFKIVDEKSLNKNTLRGVFALMVGPLKIEGWTYHVKGEKFWVNSPSKEYVDRETGEKKYQPIVRIPDKNRYWAFQNWAKEQLEGVFDEPEPQPETQTQDGYGNDDGIPF